MINVAYDSFDECLDVPQRELENLIAHFLSIGCPQSEAKRGEVLEHQETMCLNLEPGKRKIKPKEIKIRPGV